MDVDRVQSQELASWKEKYMAALFEMDKDRLNQRITDAEVAVAQRTRQLFQAVGTLPPAHNSGSARLWKLLSMHCGLSAAFYKVNQHRAAQSTISDRLPHRLSLAYCP